MGADSTRARVGSPTPLSPDTAAPPRAPIGTVGVGVIAPYDFALDRELWRWVPEEVNLLLTRTPHHVLPVSVGQAETVGDPAMLAACASSLTETSPDVVAYACTSGSFVRGAVGEALLRRAIESAGVPRAVTTSGALLEALRALGLRRIAVATPYDELVTSRLSSFVAAAGVEVVGSAALGLTERIWALPYEQVAQLVRGALRPGVEGIFVSCTNVPTFDILASLEQELGVPVLSANQVTMWSALAAVGRVPTTTGHSLDRVLGPVRVRAGSA